MGFKEWSCLKGEICKTVSSTEYKLVRDGKKYLLRLTCIPVLKDFDEKKMIKLYLAYRETQIIKKLEKLKKKAFAKLIEYGITERDGKYYMYTITNLCGTPLKEYLCENKISKECFKKRMRSLIKDYACANKKCCFTAPVDKCTIIVTKSKRFLIGDYKKATIKKYKFKCEDLDKFIEFLECALKITRRCRCLIKKFLKCELRKYKKYRCVSICSVRKLLKYCHKKLHMKNKSSKIKSKNSKKSHKTLKKIYKKYV